MDNRHFTQRENTQEPKRRMRKCSPSVSLQGDVKTTGDLRTNGTWNHNTTQGPVKHTPIRLPQIIIPPSVDEDASRLCCFSTAAGNMKCTTLETQLGSSLRSCCANTALRAALRDLGREELPHAKPVNIDVHSSRIRISATYTTGSFSTANT